MRRSPGWIAVVLAVLFAAGSARAQGSYVPDRYYLGEQGRLFIEPMVGYVFYGDLAHIDAITVGAPEDIREGIVYDLNDGVSYGLRIGYNFSNWLSLQLGGSYSPTSLQYLFGGEELKSADLIALGGSLTPTSTGLPSIDVYRGYGGITLNWTFPDVPRIVPRLGLGVAAVQYNVLDAPQTVNPLTDELEDFTNEFRPPTHIVNDSTTADISGAIEGRDFGWYFIIGMQIGVSSHVGFSLELQNFQTTYKLKDNNVFQDIDAIINNQTVASITVIISL